MKVLMFGGTHHTREILRNLMGKSGHELQFWEKEAHAGPSLDKYHMVVVDGSSGESADRVRLLDILVREIRLQSSRIPIVVMSFIDGAAADRESLSGYFCGIDRPQGGVWHLRCRLKQLAWNECHALLQDAMGRQDIEPVTFEYQG